MFIPEKLRIGYQERDDTFTGKLAYVVYYGADKKLKKETSWTGWINPKLTPHDEDNLPRDGYMFNKGVQRWGGSWYSSGRSMVRIWDPRGFEFEITVDNLMSVLTHCDVSKREILGECVLAWEGKDLVLLPVSSEEYKAASETTKKMVSKGVSSKDLEPGAIYVKRNSPNQYIYLGRLPSLRSRHADRLNKGDLTFLKQAFPDLEAYPDTLIRWSVTNHLFVPYEQGESLRSLKESSFYEESPSSFSPVKEGDILPAWLSELQDRAKNKNSIEDATSTFEPLSKHLKVDTLEESWEDWGFRRQTEANGWEGFLCGTPSAKYPPGYLMIRNRLSFNHYSSLQKGVNLFAREGKLISIDPAPLSMDKGMLVTYPLRVVPVAAPLVETRELPKGKGLITRAPYVERGRSLDIWDDLTFYAEGMYGSGWRRPKGSISDSLSTVDANRQSLLGFSIAEVRGPREFFTKMEEAGWQIPLVGGKLLTTYCRSWGW